MKNRKNKKKHIRYYLICGIIFFIFISNCVESSNLVIQKKQVNLENLFKENSSIKKRNISYVGGSGPGNYSKIQDAIENATKGDTVFVFDDSSP